jgi:hypothetical protein
MADVCAADRDDGVFEQRVADFVGVLRSSKLRHTARGCPKEALDAWADTAVSKDSWVQQGATGLRPLNHRRTLHAEIAGLRLFALVPRLTRLRRLVVDPGRHPER